MERLAISSDDSAHSPATSDADIGALLAAARSGCGSSLEILTERYRRYLLLVAHQELSPEFRTKISPAELVQVTLGELSSELQRFAGLDEEAFLAWLRQLLHYRALQAARCDRPAARDPSSDSPANAATDDGEAWQGDYCEPALGCESATTERQPDSGAQSGDSLLEKALIDCEELLANGTPPSMLPDLDLPDDLRGELTGLQECLSLLNAVQSNAELRPPNDPAQTGSPHSPDPATLHGERIGRFELIRELGRGGNGVVFLARDAGLQRDVALKVPRPEALVTSDLRRRFIREAQAAARLVHPHLVNVYEIGEEGALCYLVSQFCQGPSLSAWLSGNSRPVPARDSAQLIADLAEAMDYAHQEGVLHRDIKSANVLLEPIDVARFRAAPHDRFPLSSFVAKLADFGLAKLSESADEATRTGAVLGTLGYMAPEQALGRTREIGPAADVYALGVILYELLTGRMPFGGQSDADTLRQLVTDDPIAPSRSRANLPRDLEAICLKCLEKSPAARYSSCAALAADLRRYLAGEVTHVQLAGPGKRMVKWARRRPATAGLMLVSFLALVIIAAGSAVFSWNLAAALEASELRRVEASAAQAEAERQQGINAEFRYAAEMAQAFGALAQGDVRHVSKLLAGYDEGTPRANLRDFEWHFLKRSLHGERIALTGHQGQVYAVAYSPDGRILASGGQDGTIRLWDSATGEELKTIVAHHSCTNDLEFSADGKVLASASCDRTVKLWDTSAWRELATLSGHQNDVMCVVFSPDGSSIASGDAAGIVRVWNARSGEPIATIRAAIQDRQIAVGALEWSPNGKFLATTSDHCQLWEASTWQPISTPICHHTRSVAISHDSQLLAIAHDGHCAGIWNAQSRSKCWSIPDQIRGVEKVLFSPDGRWLYAGGGDGRVRSLSLPAYDANVPALEQVPLLTVVNTLVGHAERVQDIAISPDGLTLATASFDGTVRLWEATAKANAPRVIPGPRRPAYLSGDLSQVSMIDTDNTVTTWNIEGSPVVVRCQTPLPVAAQGAPRFSADLGSFVACDNSGRLVVGISSDAGSVKAISASPVYSFDIAADGGFAYALGLDGKASIWNVRTGEERLSTKLLTAATEHERDWVAGKCRMAISADGQSLAVANLYRGCVIDAQTGERVNLPGDEGEASTIAFSPDGRHLATIHSNGQVCLFDCDSGRQMNAMRLASFPTAIAFTPDAQTLAVGTRDGRVVIWKTHTGQELVSLVVGGDAIEQLQFSDDGRALAAVAYGSAEGMPVANVFIFDGRQKAHSNP